MTARVVPSPRQVLALATQREPHCFMIDGWGGQGATVIGIQPTRIWSTVLWPNAHELCGELKNMWAEVSHWPKTFDRRFCGGVVGLLGYEAAFGLDRVRQFRTRTLGMPHAHFGVYPVVARFENNQWSVVGDVQGFSATALALEELIEAATQIQESNLTVEPIALEVLVSKSLYMEWVQQAKHAIAQGDIYQANLSHPLRLSGESSLAELYSRIHEHNPSPWAGFYQSAEFAVLSNSPELLCATHGDRVWSKPIAGTRPRSENLQEDHRLKNELMDSAKEQAEHLMLVDLVRNDLGRVCAAGSVNVPNLLDRESYRNVTHIVSTVQGCLEKGLTGFDALLSLFPGGTITGTPKLRSMEIIDHLEEWPRGFYTGSMGWISPNGDLEFNILIRTLQVHRQVDHWNGWLHVGAGIVADSDPASEYQETLHKANAWRQILSGEH